MGIIEAPGTVAPPSDLRDGAQVVLIMCGEPCGNTPGAYVRKDTFIYPLLVKHGVQIDMGPKNRKRWLKDVLKDFGIIRLLGSHDPITTAQLSRSLKLAISAHKPEIIVLMEHTDCGERHNHNLETRGSKTTDAEEPALIAESLNNSEAWIREWHTRRGGEDNLIIVKCVAIVTGGHAACNRRLNEIVMLDDYLDRAALLERIESQFLQQTA